jgi:ABC-type phosphate transport system substrate-binding protein
MRARLLGRVVFAILISAALLRGGDVSAAEFQIIVNASNPVKSLSAEEAAKYFIKKVAKWENGAVVMPVDQVQKSPVRVAFTNDVHGKAVSAIVAYWQQQIFSGGSIPPPEKATDAAIIAFVKANPGGIGYISAGVAADGVKVVPLR